MSHLAYSDLSVLVVDDIRAARLTLKSLLKTLGIRNVVEAGDGEEALWLLATQPRDVLITDLSMSPMDGIELTRRLRRPNCGFNAGIPILMVSAHSEKSKIQEAIQAGVSAFLLKPLSPIALAEKLKKVAENRPQIALSKDYCGPDRRRRISAVKKSRRASRAAV